ncbi:checkpoint protein HUS1, partial [Pseudoliparis swirei]|uniref:checkpoint protein HUS1 n=1 Tax=Pseudoliparis swirei TaxID=2059687 RepID=UPI0024BEFB9E
HGRTKQTHCALNNPPPEAQPEEVRVAETSESTGTVTSQHEASRENPRRRVSQPFHPSRHHHLKADRMKNLSNFLVIEANLIGEMNLKIETDLVSVTTHFKDLGNPPWGDDASQDGGPSHSRDPEAMVQARVDIRKLQQFLMGQQVNPSKAMCNIVHERVVHLILLHEDVSLQYFIPAVA